MMKPLEAKLRVFTKRIGGMCQLEDLMQVLLAEGGL